jgi:hypothetical protein
MSADYHHHACHIREQLATGASENFKNDVIAEMVYEAVEEDDQLARMISVVEWANELAESRPESSPFVDEIRCQAVKASDEIQQKYEYRIKEIVASVCSKIVDEENEWLSAVETEHAKEFIGEAQEWLTSHPCAVNRLSEVGLSDQPTASFLSNDG